jgi:hypothetical protein
VSVFELQDPKKPGVPGHFRIWKDVYNSLEDEARAREVSLNTLVNQLLSTHTRNNSVYEKLGVVKMPKDTYRLALQLIPDDKLGEFGRELVKRYPTSLMLARKGAITIDAVLNELSDATKMGFFSLYEAERDGMKVISLTHDLGPRYSVVLSAAVTALFELVSVRPRITITDSSVTVEY